MTEEILDPAAFLRSAPDAVKRWNERYGITPARGPNLFEADLRGLELNNIVLHGADLRKARLDGAKLRGAYLGRADLTRASLQGADCAGAVLTKVDLTMANLEGCKLVGTNLRRALFSRSRIKLCDFRGATFDETVFASTDLREARNLDAVYHHGPSRVDFLSIAGVASDTRFLRGVGLPERLIDYLPSLSGDALDFSSCFISYSTCDEAFATKLHADLQENGVRCWFAPRDIQGGKKTHEQITEAIELHDRLLLILSEASIASDWVEYEIRRARRKEKQEERRVLFPLRLVDFDSLRAWECFDADSGRDLATEVREYYIPDFTTWADSDQYEQRLSGLLRDLQAT